MRSSALKGMAVVSSADGQRLGKVDDLVIDSVERRVVGLHCSGQGRQFVVPLEHVRSIGKDAIIVENSQATQMEGQGGQPPTTLCWMCS